MTTSEIREQARRMSRVDTNGIPDSHVNDLINDAMEQLAKDVYGFPAEDYLTVTPKFDTRKNYALKVTITGGTNALAETDVEITGTNRTDTAGATVATDLQTRARADVGSGANLTVSWDSNAWAFTFNTIDGTRLQIDSPASNVYIDACPLLFGESGIDETEAAASYTGGFPEDCTVEVDMPSDFQNIEYVEWDDIPLTRMPGKWAFSPETSGTPTHYYVRGKKLRLWPVPTEQKKLHVVYKEYPTAITSFDTQMPSTVPSECHKAIAYWVAHEMLGEEFQEDKADRYYGKYWRERNKYVVNYANQQTKMDEEAPEALWFRVDI